LGTNLYFSFVYYRILTFSNGNKKNYELEKMSIKNFNRDTAFRKQNYKKKKRKS